MSNSNSVDGNNSVSKFFDASETRALGLVKEAKSAVAGVLKDTDNLISFKVANYGMKNVLLPELQARLEKIQREANQALVSISYTGAAGDTKKLREEIGAVHHQVLKEAAAVLLDMEKFMVRREVVSTFLEEDKDLRTEEADHYLNSLESGGWKGTLMQAAYAVAKFFKFSDDKLPAPLRVTAAYLQAQKKLAKAAQEYVSVPIEIPGQWNDKMIAFAARKIKVLILPKASEPGEIDLVRAPFVKTHKAAMKQLGEFGAQMRHLTKRVIEQKMLTLPPTGSKAYENYLESIDRPQPDGKKEIYSKLIPANQALDDAWGMKDTFGPAHGFYGVPSGDPKGSYAVNMMFDVVGSFVTKPIRLLRHGIHSGRFQADPVKRKEEALAKAKEAVTAAAASRIQSMAAAEDTTADKVIMRLIKDGKPLIIRTLSNSLITPDPFRKFLDKLTGKESNESRMLQEHLEAYETLAKMDKLTVKIGGEEIRVDFKAFCLNYGVNKGAKWGADEQNKTNKENLKELKKYITDVLMNASLKQGVNQQNIEMIGQLLRHIEEMNEHPGKYLESGDYYEINMEVSTLGVLLQSITDGELQTEVECMSGKDRTSIAIARLKARLMLAAEIGRVPTHEDLNPTAAAIKEKEMCRGPQDRYVELYIQDLMDGLTIKPTALNTGKRGAKVEAKLIMPYPENPVWKRPENKDILQYVLGLSNLAKA